jgi:DNA (cytosine-5)-methyltransferase 1
MRDDDHLPASAFGAPHRRDRIWLIAYPGGEQHEGTGDADERPGAARLSQADLGDPDQERWNGRAGQLGPRRRGESEDAGWRKSESGLGGMAPRLSGGLDSGCWDREPDIPRVAVGVPQRVDRLRALGNALVPQIAEWIGRRILAWEES